MLILSRKVDEVVVIGDIRIMVVAIRSDKVRLGITAPPGVEVDRLEVHLAKQNERREAQGNE